MATSLPPDKHSFREKPEKALRFLALHPTLYHPDVVVAARQELQRRGISVVELEPVDTTLPTAEPATEAKRFPVAVVLGLAVVGLLALLLLGSRRPDSAAPAAAAPAGPPAPLAIVQTDPLPSFDSLTARQALQTPATLPAAERADTNATRRFRTLAGRYWAAENQTDWLLRRVADQTVPEPALLGRISLTHDQWKHFTYALRYDHRLTPTMLARVALMQQAADLRGRVLDELYRNQVMGNELFNEDMLARADSAYALRYAVLGQPLPAQLPGLPRQLTNELQMLRTLPAPRPNTNPVYVLYGELLPSDPSTAAAPPQVQHLPAGAIDSVLVLRPAAAVRTFGPRAHDGAIVIFTRPGLP